MQTYCPAFLRGNGFFYVIFHVFNVNNNVHGKNRDQRAEKGKGRFDSFGPDGFSADGQKDDEERFDGGCLKTQPPRIFPIGLCSDAKRRRNK